jgi:methyl-accepting chemotaxis protein
MKSRFSLGTKEFSLSFLLKLQTALPLVVFILFVLSAIASVSGLTKVLDTVLDEELPGSVQEGVMSSRFHEFLFWMMASNQPGATTIQRNERLVLAESSFAKFIESVDAYSSLKRAPETQDYFIFILDARAQLIKDIKEARVLAEMIEHRISTPEALANYFEDKLVPETTPVENALENLAALHNILQKQAHVDALESTSVAKLRTIILSVIGALLVLILGQGLRLRIMGVLSALSQKLSISFESVSASTSALAEVSDVLSLTAFQATTSLEESSASLRHIDQGIEKTMNDTVRSSESSKACLTTAYAGAVAVASVVETMELIKSSSHQLEEFLVIMQSIRTQVGVIDEIVFKSELLSFNASIEVARAGVHGRAFGVVAEEITNLAKISGRASGQIEKLLDESIGKAKSLLSEVHARVDQGARKSAELDQVFGKIVKEISAVNATMQGIARASQEQSASVSQVSAGTSELSDVLVSNSNAALKVTKTTGQLNGEAKLLDEILSTLSKAIGEERFHSSPSTVPRATSEADQDNYRDAS